MTSLRLRMLEDMQIRDLAVNTQESYVQQVSLFARYFNQSPERLGPEQIRTYQVYLTKEKKLATGSILIAISALRFLLDSLGGCKVSQPVQFVPHFARNRAAEFGQFHAFGLLVILYRDLTDFSIYQLSFELLTSY